MTITSNMSFYDTIGILVMGFLWIFILGLFECLNKFVCIIIQGSIGQEVKDAVLIMIVLIASYAIGLIYHRVMECLSHCIKNNKKECLNKVLTCFGLNYWRIVIESYKNYYGNADNSDKEKIKEKYLKAYYKMLKTAPLAQIPVMEAQVAFIRNLIPIIVVGAIRYCVSINFAAEYPSCYLFIVLFVIIVLCIVIVLFIIIPLLWTKYKIQRSICNLVWEADKFYEAIEKEENENSTQM